MYGVAIEIYPGVVAVESGGPDYCRDAGFFEIDTGWGVDAQCFGIDVVCGVIFDLRRACFVGEAVDHAEELSGEGVAELDVFTEIVTENGGVSFESLEPAKKVYAGAPECLEADCFSTVDTRGYGLSSELVFGVFETIRCVFHES